MKCWCLDVRLKDVEDIQKSPKGAFLILFPKKVVSEATLVSPRRPCYSCSITSWAPFGLPVFRHIPYRDHEYPSDPLANDDDLQDTTAMVILNRGASEVICLEHKTNKNTICRYGSHLNWVRHMKIIHFSSNLNTTY